MCMNDMTLRGTIQGNAARYGEGIRGVLSARGVNELSDAELERALGPCIAGPTLVQVARQMRDAGLLTAEQVQRA